MDKIYKYSDKYVNQQKKLTVYFAVAMWLLLTLVMLFAVGVNSITFLIIASNGIIFALVIYFSFRFYFTSMKRLEIHLTTDGIQRKNGNKIETFLYKDIKKINIKSTKSGEPKSVQVDLPKKVIIIYVLEDMNGFVAELKNKISKNVVKQKTMILDWTNPVVTVSFLLVIIIVVYGGVYVVQQYTNLNITKIIAVLWVLMGIKYLYSKPMSRTGNYSEKYDVLFGIFFILLGLVQFFNLFK